MVILREEIILVELLWDGRDLTDLLYVHFIGDPDTDDLDAISSSGDCLRDRPGLVNIRLAVCDYDGKVAHIRAVSARDSVLLIMHNAKPTRDITPSTKVRGIEYGGAKVAFVVVMIHIEDSIGKIGKFDQAHANRFAADVHTFHYIGDELQ